ncbi:tetratricopeptide repeat protein [Amylibacter sp.]|nr:tetratricopeptide repeat protein [Amylibacter sp.]
MVELSLEQAFSQADYHVERGEVSEARKFYQAILSAVPDNERAQTALTALHKVQASTDMQSPPQEIINQLLNLYNSGNLEAVVEQANLLTEQYPEAFAVWNILGAANKGLGDLDKASQAFKKVTELSPNNAEGFNNMGVTLQDQGKLEEALVAFNRVLDLHPDHTEVHFNIGNAFQTQSRLEEAIEAYKKALSLKPDRAEAYYNMGITLQEQGKLVEAIEAYKKALSFKPDYADAYYNMAIVLQIQGKLDEAIVSFEKVLKLKPDYAYGHYNMGVIFQNQGNCNAAITSYAKALSLEPSNAKLRSLKLFQQAKICDWKALEEDRPLWSRLGVSGKAVEAFALLSFEDAPERHRLRSENYAKEHFPVKSTKQFEKPSQMPKRLRIGYFSADFKEHPASYLMFKIIECHDRSLFDVYGYSIGQPKLDKMREKISGAFDVFKDIHSSSDIEALKTIHNDKIDIAIDLTGYTKDSRTNLFSSRLAPVQINYLGYPGTLGADFMDYIVADQNLIPEAFQEFYIEKQIYLPHTYWPTNNIQAISQKVQTKEDMGLPSDGFVFCCFNNNYKISPKEFDIWMRLMGKVEGSVLWLLKSNKWAEHNMKREVEARGVSADRVVFAERVENSEHLARHRLADLFLDTFNYNAHTTASDALWAGLPLVTKLGKGFATRVAGSLLNAVGLPELITHNENDYEALILELATNPKKLNKIKKKLEVNRLSKPLFNTEQYTKHLENGYLQAYQRHFKGEKPDTIFVKE